MALTLPFCVCKLFYLCIFVLIAGLRIQVRVFLPNYLELSTWEAKSSYKNFMADILTVVLL